VADGFGFDGACDADVGAFAWVAEEDGELCACAGDGAVSSAGGVRE